MNVCRLDKGGSVPIRKDALIVKHVLGRLERLRRETVLMIDTARVLLLPRQERFLKFREERRGNMQLGEIELAMVAKREGGKLMQVRKKRHEMFVFYSRRREHGEKRSVVFIDHQTVNFIGIDHGDVRIRLGRVEYCFSAGQSYEMMCLREQVQPVTLYELEMGLE